MLMNCTVIAVAIIVNNHIICKQNQFHLLDFYRSTLNCKNHILQYIHILQSNNTFFILHFIIILKINYYIIQYIKFYYS